MNVEDILQRIADLELKVEELIDKQATQNEISGIFERIDHLEAGIAQLEAQLSKYKRVANPETIESVLALKPILARLLDAINQLQKG